MLNVGALKYTILPITFCKASYTQKEDKKDCKNYREITLLNVVYKIFINCILLRIIETAESVIGNS